MHIKKIFVAFILLTYATTGYTNENPIKSLHGMNPLEVVKQKAIRKVFTYGTLQQVTGEGNSTTNDVYFLGKVGIGTSTPDTKLDLQAYEASNWIATIANTATYGHKIYAGYNNGSNTSYGLLITGGRGAANQADLAVENKFYVNGDGKVGIGTSSPNAILELKYNSAHTSYASAGQLPEGLRLYNTNTTTGALNNLSFSLANAGTAGAAISLVNTNTSGASSTATGDLIFATKTSGLSTLSERLRINSDGNVGIGINNPTYKLHVYGQAGFTEGIMVNRLGSVTNGFINGINMGGWDVLGYSTDGFGVIFGGYRAPQFSSISMYTSGVERLKVTEAGNLLLNNGTGTADGAALVPAGTSLQVYASTGSQSLSRAIIFNTHGTTGGEKMRIRADGNIGIGTDNPSERLSVNGNIRTKKIIVTQEGWPDYVFHSTYHLRSLSELEKYIQENKHLPEVPSTEEVEKSGVDIGDVQVQLLKKIEELTLYVIEQQKEIQKQQMRIKALEKNNGKK